MSTIIALFLFIYCIIKINSLEKEIIKIKKGTTLPSVATETYQPEPTSFTTDRFRETVNDVPLAAIPPAYTPQLVSETELTFVDNFFAWLKQDFMVKLGALLLLIGFGWFASYAFANNWIGPVGRITLGILAGLGFMVLGFQRMELSRHQGSIFMVLGSAVVMLTVFAAREMYDLFTPVSALAVMFATIVLIARVAVMYQSSRLAAAGFVLAAIAPFMTAASTSDVSLLFSYLTVIVLGSLWVLFRINATVLMLLSFLAVCLYTLPYIDSYKQIHSDTVLGFGFFFVALFFLANSFSIIKWSSTKLNYSHLVVAIGSGLYCALLIAAEVDASWQPLLYGAWSMVFAVGAFAVYLSTATSLPFYLYGSVSIGLLAAATAELLSGPALTLAYTIEVTALVWLAIAFAKNTKLAVRLSFLYAVPALLSLESMMSNAWNTNNILHDDFFILLTLILSFGIVATRWYQEREVKMAGMFAIFALTYSLILIWLSSHALLAYDQGTLVSLVIYTLVGLSLFIEGKASGNDEVKQVGAVLIGLVVVRLLFVDVWAMELFGRIITFFSIGALLISTAFIKKIQK